MDWAVSSCPAPTGTEGSVAPLQRTCRMHTLFRPALLEGTQSDGCGVLGVSGLWYVLRTCGARCRSPAFGIPRLGESMKQDRPISVADPVSFLCVSFFCDGHFGVPPPRTLYVLNSPTTILFKPFHACGRLLAQMMLTIYMCIPVMNDIKNAR